LIALLLTVTPSSAQEVVAGDVFQVDFGQLAMTSNEEAPDVWNNVAGEVGAAAQLKVDPMLDGMTTSTGKKCQEVRLAMPVRPRGVGIGGALYRESAVEFPKSASQDNMYIQGASTMELSGLNPALKYEIEIYGGVPTSVQDVSRSTMISVNGEEKEFDARGNATETVVFTAIETSDGVIQIMVGPGSDSTQANLNLMIIRALP
jgi:hypothetical protein